MKKKIVFVIPSLDAGGGEKSLINLLSVIDPSKYEVDLVLLHRQGIFLKMLPGFVRLVDLGENHKIFSAGASTSVAGFLKAFKIGHAIDRIAFALKSRFIKNTALAEQYSWKNLRNAIPALSGEYDAAIGFLEKTSVYFTIDRINAKRKIGFIHNDYLKLGLDREFDRPYFKKLDAIVTVSDECDRILKEVFPEFSQKIHMMHNIVSPKLIQRLSEMPADDMEVGTSILSVGRLHPQKGFEMAVDACEIVVRSGKDVKWYIIGEGPEREMIENKISEKGLSKNFILLGLKDNPYAYLRKATIYAQTSRYEGKSIAIDEAKIMHKPIVVTDFSTVKDQIEDGRNGLIAKMNAQSIAEAILRMLDHDKFRADCISALESENLGTESEIEKLYSLIENK